MIVILLAASAPVAVLLLHVLLQRTVCTGGEPRARLKLVIQIVLGVTVTWGILAAVVLRGLPVPLLLLNIIYVMIVTFGLGMCYFNVFALSETALRIRFLMEAYAAEKRGGAGAWNSRSLEDYDAATLIGMRIDRLLTMGAARERDGKILVVSVPLILTARLFHFAGSAWKHVLFGAASDDRASEVWKNL
jgi:hypothetical protein